MKFYSYRGDEGKHKCAHSNHLLRKSDEEKQLGSVRTKDKPHILDKELLR